MASKTATPAKVKTESRNPSSLARVTAVSRLERENAQLRGDLRTISRRLGHDLSNPLNCISTANQGLIELFTTPDPLAACFHVSIAESVNEAAALVQRLNVFLRTTADVGSSAILEMGKIIAVALQGLSPLIVETRAIISTCSHWPAVRGVAPWIGLVWEISIRNSLQHAHAQSLKLELGCDCRNEGHRLWIRDNGRGVAPEKRSRLFHPFELLSEANAPHGYGLPIVKRLVEMQEGSCGFEPQSPTRACFFFTLPTA